MMLFKYFAVARQSLQRRRSRSLLTIAGIVAGVGSVTLLINVGLGAQEQILGANSSSDDRLTVRSGQVVSRDESGGISQYNLAQAAGFPPSLTAADLRLVEAEPRIAQSSPVAVLGEEIGNLSGDKFANGHALAADADLLELVGYELGHGSNALDGERPTAVIGDEVARELFNNSRPISHEIILGERSFIVVGVLEKPGGLNPLSLGFNYRRAVLVPFSTVEQFDAEQQETTPIYEILARAKRDVDGRLVDELNDAILANHLQKQDFTVFKDNELAFVTGSLFEISRNLIVAIAAIFLGIGGIGLMNAMQASVAERRLEISLRKAVGATGQQIFHQFMVESFLLSAIGGVLGVTAGLAGGLLTDYLTPVRPVIQLDVILLMLILAPTLGLLFGSQAALRASLQKPDEHLG